jgi:hypothetical protein
MSRADIMQALQSECTMSDETALDIMEHRQKVVKIPLTVRSAKAISKELAKVGDVEKAVDHWLTMGWRGFKAEWFNKPNRFQEQNNPAPKNVGGAPGVFQPLPPRKEPTAAEKARVQALVNKVTGKLRA